MTKAKLYHLIKMHKPQYGIFAIDSLLADHGHTVLRLPPYHPDLNPIEQIWGIVKTRIAAINVTFKLRDVQQMAEQKCAAVTMEERAAVCRLLELWEKSVWVERAAVCRLLELWEKSMWVERAAVCRLLELWEKCVCV